MKLEIVEYVLNLSSNLLLRLLGAKTVPRNHANKNIVHKNALTERH